MNGENGDKTAGEVSYKGWRARLEGKGAAIIILFFFSVFIVVALVAMGMLVWKENSEIKLMLNLHAAAVSASDAKYREEVIAAFRDLASRQDRTTEAQNEMNYIATLTQQQKEALKIGMPESLKRKLRRTEDR